MKICEKLNHFKFKLKSDPDKEENWEKIDVKEIEYFKRQIKFCKNFVDQTDEEDIKKDI